MIKTTNVHGRLSLLAGAAGVFALALPLLLAQTRSGEAQTSRGAADELSEPPLELRVRIDGQEHDARLGRELEVRIGDRDVKLSIDARPHRTFRAAGIEFEYPREFSFDVERDAAMIWTLDGSSAVITVVKFPMAAPLQDVLQMALESTKAELGAQDFREGAAALKLEGKEVAGQRLTVKLGSTTIQQDYFAFSRGDSTLVLIVQDTPDGDKPSAEMVRTKELLERSFRLLP